MRAMRNQEVRRAQGREGFAGWVKIVAPMLAAVAGLIALRLLGPDVINQRELSQFLRRFGELAPVVFVLFLAARPVTLLPGQLLTAVGGLLFGAAAGTVYALIGSVLSCGLIFILARVAGGGKLLRRLTGKRYEAVVDATRGNGFKLAAIVTMNPLIPTDVFVAAAASAKARFAPTALGVLVGTLPGTFITAQFGSALGQGKTIMTAVSVAGMVLSLLLGLWLGRRMVRQIQDADRAPVPAPPRRATMARAAAV